tara:strand:- start:84 stop:524 length:441 start_codon:yes stop_codon:yes gene_type:complete
MATTAEAPHLEAIVGNQVQQTPFERVISSEATKRLPMWVVPHRAKVVEVFLINSTAVTGADTNTVHLNLINGGLEGAGTTELAARDLVMGTDLDVGKTSLYAPASALFTAAGTMLELESEEIGTGLGSDINALLIWIVYRASDTSS